MTIHYLSVGGNQRSQTLVDLNAGLFPSKPFGADQHSTITPHSPTRTEYRPGRLAVPCEGSSCWQKYCDECLEDGTQKPCGQSSAIGAYIANPNNPPIANGDRVVLVQLSRRTTFERLKWEIFAPISPLTFDIEMSDVDANGVPTGPITVLGSVNGAVKSGDVLDVKTLLGAAHPHWVNTNKVLMIHITAMPPIVTTGCNGCAGSCGGLNCLDMEIGAVMESYEAITLV
jgi:hypothetical protein